MQKTLKSKRLVLRPVAPVDADWLVDLWSLPEVHRNVASIPASPDKDFVLRRIHSGNEGEEAFTDICRMIELDEKRAGMISLNRTSIVDAFGLGYSLHPEFSGHNDRGRSNASELVRRLRRAKILYLGPFYR